MTSSFPRNSERRRANTNRGQCVNRSHHDVLGIRTNAGREEIELAYKGRRSQYHPDRYAQSNAETQRWANACMQDVNVAYAALIDAPPWTGPIPPVQRADATTAKTSAAMTLAEAMRNHSISKCAMDRIYIAPNIPLKKLHNALDSYGDHLKPSDVVVLLDDTIFGSGKDGLLVTESHLLVKEAFQPHCSWGLDGIVLSESGGKLHVNNRLAGEFKMVDKSDVRAFVKALGESLASRSAGPAPAPPRASASVSPTTANYLLEELFLELLQQLEKAKGEQNWSTVQGRKAGNMLALMEVAVSLTDKLQDAAEHVRGAPPTPDDLRWLRSDPVRMELLTYQFAWLSHNLKNRRGRSDTQVDHDLQMFMSFVITPSLAAQLAKDSDDYERAVQSLPASGLLQAFGRRAQHYFDVLSDPSSDIGVQLFNGICNPVAFNTPRSSKDQAELAHWQASAKDACGFNSLGLVARDMHQILGMGLDATFGPNQ